MLVRQQVFKKYVIYRPFPELRNLREVLDPQSGDGYFIDTQEKIRIGDYYPVTSKSKEGYRYIN